MFSTGLSSGKIDLLAVAFRADAEALFRYARANKPFAPNAATHDVPLSAAPGEIALATAKFCRQQRNPLLRAARPPLRTDLDWHDDRPRERIHSMTANVGQPIRESGYEYRLHPGGRKIGQDPQSVDLPDCFAELAAQGSQLAHPVPT